jgi:hypothetical protein
MKMLSVSMWRKCEDENNSCFLVVSEYNNNCQEGARERRTKNVSGSVGRGTPT